jgi:hypothetical protein
MTPGHQVSAVTFDLKDDAARLVGDGDCLAGNGLRDRRGNRRDRCQAQTKGEKSAATHLTR